MVGRLLRTTVVPMNRKKFLIGAGLLVAITASIATPYSSTVSRLLLNPGPLSQPHEFLESRCDACHTPVKGVEASSCIVCHANDDALLQREPTAFHGSIGSCSECHLEHGGRIQRPISMDHEALLRIGLRQMEDSSAEDSSDREGMVRFLSTGHASVPQSRLNCATCHAKEDPHSGQFGSSCIACHTTERWSIAAFRHPRGIVLSATLARRVIERRTSGTFALKLLASRTPKFMSAIPVTNRRRGMTLRESAGTRLTKSGS